MTEDQIISQRQSLVDELTEVVERHRVSVGCGMVSTDGIGAIETVKLTYFMAEINTELGDS